MEPIPETAEALAELSVASGYDLLAELQERTSLVQDLVPDCVGVSVAALEHGVTFTLVACKEDVAVLDGASTSSADRASTLHIPTRS